MNRQFAFMTLAILIVASLFTAHVYAAPTAISSVPFTITTSGIYVITKNLAYPGSGNAITITANNVNLYFGGHKLTATSNPATLVEVEASNVHIYGPGTITGFTKIQGFGIFLFNAVNSLVSGLRLTGNGAGVELSGGSDNQVSNCRISGNTVGAGLEDSSGNSFTGNKIDNGDEGFDLGGASSNNVLANNVIFSNHVFGIDLLGSPSSAIPSTTSNTIRGNVLFDDGQFGIGLFGAASSNLIEHNVVTNSGIGIDLGNMATSNTVNHNISLHNSIEDMFDGNANCDSNTWANNVFKTSNVPCIH